MNRRLLLPLLLTLTACEGEELTLGGDASPHLERPADASPDALDAGTDSGPEAGQDAASDLSPNYLVVTADALKPAALALADYRARTGFRPELLVAAKQPLKEAVVARLRELAQESPDEPLFVVLLDDAPDADAHAPGRVPGLPCPNLLGECMTDEPYGDLDGDGVAEASVGRIPARSVEEALAYLARLERHDATHETGLWNKRVLVYTGEPGFGPELDARLEAVVMQGLSTTDPAFDIVGLYASPYSPYYYEPFSQKVVELYNEGNLMTVYIGHGSSTETEGLGMAELPSLNSSHRLPVTLLFACSTGEYVGDPESLAESLVRHDGGPIGVLAASGTSHPYGNAILAYEAQRVAFESSPPTMGQLMGGLERASLDHIDAFRRLVDGASVISGVPMAEQAQIRQEHVALYNYFGDPAAAAHFPLARALFDEVEGHPVEGPVTVTGQAPGVADGEAVVTIEVARDAIINELEPVDPNDPDRAVVQRNWKAAMDKRVAQAVVPVDAQGRFQAILTPTQSLPPGRYFVKVYAQDGLHDAVGGEPLY